MYSKAKNLLSLTLILINRMKIATRYRMILITIMILMSKYNKIKIKFKKTITSYLIKINQILTTPLLPINYSLHIQLTKITKKIHQITTPFYLQTPLSNLKTQPNPTKADLLVHKPIHLHLKLKYQKTTSSMTA